MKKASLVIAAGALLTAVNAQATEPAIKPWEDVLWSTEEWPEGEAGGTRLLTGLFLAMYLAGAEVDDRYELGVTLPAAEATADEAAAAAGEAYLKTYFKEEVGRWGKVRRLKRREDLQALAAASAKMAFEMVNATISDPVPYRPFTVPGRYVQTKIPADAYTAHLQHFAFDPVRATQIAPPPAVDSDAFAASYNETKRLGAADSEVRTEDQAKASMIYDLQDPHPMIYRIMEARDLSLFEQARIMAIYDMGIEDVLMAQFAGKLHFQSWRPITAIRNGDIDGRDDTEIDPAWTPLLETPNSSEYPCGHCTFVSATASMLEVLLPLGEGEKVVIKASDIFTEEENRGFDGDLVSYVEGFEFELDSYADFAIDGSMSRIYNGAHFRYSTDAGLALGKEVAATAVKKWDGLPD